MNGPSNEDIYAALVAILAKMIDAEQREKGVTRINGDFKREAIQLISQTKDHLHRS